jgi:hypothetical protein
MNNTTLSGTMPKRNVIANIIIFLLLIFFVHTLSDSYMRLQSLKNVLAFYTKNTTAVAWTIIIVEIITALLLFLKKTQIFGLTLIILISSFAGYILFSTPRYPHAFGGILNYITPNQHIIVYSLLILLSILSLWLKANKVIKRTIPEPQTIVFT